MAAYREKSERLINGTPPCEQLSDQEAEQYPTNAHQGQLFLDKLCFKQFLVLTVTGDVCTHYFIMTSDLMLRRITEKGNWF